MKAWSPEDLESLRIAAGRPYVEFLREPSMSVGLYTLLAGGNDGQSPHDEDEIYIVMAGRSRFTAGDETRDVSPGDVIFVPAHVPHRFHDITLELRIAVVFAPPGILTAVNSPDFAGAEIAVYRVALLARD